MLSVEAVDKTYPPARGLQALLTRGAQRRPVPALRGVDFRIERGEILGLVGPNGAGKTTLLKTITTLLRPDSGRVTIGGHDTVANRLEAQRRTGLVLTDDRALYWRLTGLENLRFFGVMYGLPAAEADVRARQSLAQVGLANRDRMTAAYSSGMRTRLAIARALLHDPDLLVLDEATRSLDPVAAERVGRLLRRRAERGSAVLLASHRLDEVAVVCDRVMVLIDGTVRFIGPTDELAKRADFASSVMELIADDRPDDEWDL